MKESRLVVFMFSTYVCRPNIGSDCYLGSASQCNLGSNSLLTTSVRRATEHLRAVQGAGIFGEVGALLVTIVTGIEMRTRGGDDLNPNPRCPSRAAAADS